MNWLQDLFSIATTFFLVANPIGNSPGILTLLQGYSLKEQKRILLRESLLAALLALFFQYLGKPFLDLLFVKSYTLALAGGVLLLIISLGMIFPHHQMLSKPKKSIPLLVPIATPLICGPGLLTTIMLYTQRYPDHTLISSSILLAWCAVTFCLVLAPYLNTLLGKRGLIALEQFMGMILLMIGVEIFIGGIKAFAKTL